jgi:NAD(P)-dependent dehydrogenase (short-subunit alcohol dehydrogenase family)
MKQMIKKKVLITGASGFIGSTAVDKAIELGYDTWAGIRSSSSRKYLTDSRIQFAFLDCSNKNSLKNQLTDLAEKHGKFDYIIHIAGLTKAIRKSDFFQNPQGMNLEIYISRKSSINSNTHGDCDQNENKMVSIVHTTNHSHCLPEACPKRSFRVIFYIICLMIKDYQACLSCQEILSYLL